MDMDARAHKRRCLFHNAVLLLRLHVGTAHIKTHKTMDHALRQLALIMWVEKTFFFVICG